MADTDIELPDASADEGSQQTATPAAPAQDQDGKMSRQAKRARKRARYKQNKAARERESREAFVREKLEEKRVLDGVEGLSVEAEAQVEETDPLKRKLAATVKRLKAERVEKAYVEKLRHQYKLQKRAKMQSQQKESVQPEEVNDEDEIEESDDDDDED